MSLPDFDPQIELLGLQLQRDKLFAPDDRYRLFNEKIYPVLVNLRKRLATLYCEGNGRPAVEPVWVLGGVAWLTRGRYPGGPKTDLLRRVFEEYYKVEGDTVEPAKVIEAKSVQNPYDPDASFRQKQDKKWVGYVLQVAETVPKKGTGFITSMVTQTAVGSDEVGMTQSLTEQEAMGFEKPKALYVDAAYVSAGVLAQADREQRALWGPAVSARKPKDRYSVEQFKIDLNRGRAVCPAGQSNTQLSRVQESRGTPLEHRFEWSWKCRGCVQRSLCLRPEQNHRTVRVGADFMHLQARRVLMKSEAFRRKMRKRAGIEGTISEVVRGYGARRARYRGLVKVKLQNYFIGAACNMNRWIRRLVNHKNNLTASQTLHLGCA